MPPSIEDGPKQVVGIVNTRVDLACNSIGLPVPEVKWEKNNQVSLIIISNEWLGECLIYQI